MLFSRRHVVRLAFGGAVASLLAACQMPSGPSSAAPTVQAAAPTASNPLVKPRASGAELTALPANSELAVGRARFAVGLLDQRNQPINSGTVRFEFFKMVKTGNAEKRADADATFRSVGGASKGVWVAQTTFTEAGQWGGQVTQATPTDAPKTARFNFEVLDKTSAPGYDEPAPRSVSLTERDVGGDTSHICSGSPPCSMHSLSIAEALDSAQKPLVVLFATPALCTSATCAPELDAVQQLKTNYGDRANFIHVEIYQYPFDGQRVVKTVDEWRLPSDPWTFVVDRGGIVRDRFEGAAPLEELEPALKSVLT